MGSFEKTAEFLTSVGAIDTTPRDIRSTEKIIVVCAFCRTSEKAKSLSVLIQNLKTHGYHWRCQSCALPAKAAAARKFRVPKKIHTEEELKAFGLVDAMSRPISRHDSVLVRCVGHDCGTTTYKKIDAVRDTYRRYGFGYQCSTCFAKKIANRSDSWHQAIKSAAQSPEHKARAVAHGKAKIKYSADQIQEAISSSGAVLVSGDLSTPSNTVLVRWDDGLERSIRIRRFMIDGQIEKPKVSHLNPNKLRHAEVIKAAGLTIEMLGRKKANVTYRGYSWEQRWVNAIDRKCHKMMKKIDVGIRIDDLVGTGLSLGAACRQVGVSAVTYYRRRKQGFDPVESAMSINAIETIITLPGAVYNRKLEGTSFRPDIVLHNSKLIVEVDGLKWHTEEKKARDYHVKRFDAFASLGFAVLGFTSMEVLEKRAIVDSMIQHRLKKSLNKVGARKCSIVELAWNEANVFFKENHLKEAGSGRCMGLHYDGQVVAAIRWNKVDEETVNISRFSCRNGWSVPGAYSRLLKTLPNKKIINFVDRRHGTGEGLLNLGFEKVSSHIGFEWTDGEYAFNRRRFLGNSGYDHGLLKVYDYGQVKYVRKARDPG